MNAPELMEHLEQTLTVSLGMTTWEEGDDADGVYRAFLRIANMLAANLDMELSFGPPERNGDNWTFPIQPAGFRDLWLPPSEPGWSATWEWSEKDDLC